MRYRRSDIVDRAITLLDAGGIEALSMRKLAADLGVQPSALYHHVANKDALLAAMADDILRRGRRPAEIVTWDAELTLLVVALRDAIRRHRDGAALIERVHRTEPDRLEGPLRDALDRAGAEDRVARVGSRSLVRFVLAHEGDEPEDFVLALRLLLDGLRQQLTASL